MENLNSQLISMLRQEAMQIKECAVQYFVRTMMFVPTFIGAIMIFNTSGNYLYLASVFALFVLSSTTRIMLHKYGTANRNLGYELHLERSKNFPKLYESKSVWNDDYQHIGWEEAMRAWRIVQATVFEAVCKKRYNKYKVDVKKMKYPWFDIKRLIGYGEGASYYAGSFLRRSVSVLNALMLFSLFPLLLFILKEWGNWTNVGIGSMTIVLGMIYTIHTLIYSHYRLYQLESGILSIASCGIIWHAVILAHYRALERREECTDHDRTRENGYAYNVSVLAKSLANSVDNIHDWIEGKRHRRTVRHRCNRPRKILATRPKSMEFRIVDYSDCGLGLMSDVKPKLEKGDKVSFEGKQYPPGVVTHITRKDAGIYMTGIKCGEVNA